MSRSYKKAWHKDSANRWVKRYASRKVRHSLEVSDGGSFKKMFEQWDLSDFKWWSTDPKDKRK